MNIRTLGWIALCCVAACNPQPEVEVRTLIGSKNICIVTAFSVDHANYGLLAAANHMNYARLHGYTSRSYSGRISDDLFVDPLRGDLSTLRGGGLYWQKLVAVRNLLQGEGSSAPSCNWVMWVDADVIFTNPDLLLETLIEEANGSLQQTPNNVTAAADTQVILSREEAGEAPQLNAGVFLVKNSPQGRNFIDSIIASYPAYKDKSWPEQDSMYDLVAPELGEPAPQARRFSATMLPQRRLNAFYNPDIKFGPTAAWQPGDFIAHLVNARPATRARRLRSLLQPNGACDDGAWEALQPAQPRAGSDSGE
jgi:hypothetical protein